MASNSTAKNGPQEPEKPRIRVVDRRHWAQNSDDMAKNEQEPQQSDSQANSAQDDTNAQHQSMIADLRRKLADKEEHAHKIMAQYREALTEFESAKSRLRNEISAEVQRGKKSLVEGLLDVVDNLERAIDAVDEAMHSSALHQGVLLVHEQFQQTMSRFGVERFEAEGAEFDPQRHEAISQVPVKDPEKDGKVISVIKPGYLMGDEVLRAAVVAVGSHRGEASQEPTETTKT